MAEMAEGAGVIRLRCPAKINLFLCVNYRRTDGYHDLTSLMCPVSLYDRLDISPGKGSIEVRCDHPDVPDDERNLAHQAALRFCARAGVPSSVTITLSKTIPVAAGLGGGSSDAAGVLLGLNRMFGAPFSRSTLMDIGKGLGADVPFFILEKPALAAGVGDLLTPVDWLPPRPVVLVNPGVKASTAAVYGGLNLALTKCKKKLRGTDFGNHIIDISKILCNDLESVTMAAHPEIGVIKKALTDLGAEGALMSGSGPTVFGLFSDMKRAERATMRLSEEPNWSARLVELLT